MHMLSNDAHLEKGCIEGTRISEWEWETNGYNPVYVVIMLSNEESAVMPNMYVYYIMVVYSFDNAS